MYMQRKSSSAFNMESFIPILTLEQSVNDAKGVIYLIDLLQIQYQKPS